jgi:hypothetical protein
MRIALGLTLMRRSSAAIGAAPAAPSNTVAPAITGSPVVGQLLTCSTGTWTGTPVITYTYQWKRNGVNIGGATSSTYTLVQADASNTANIKCTVTATNAVSAVAADSNVITVIYDFDANALIINASYSDPTQLLVANQYFITGKASVGPMADGLACYGIMGGTTTFHKWNWFNPLDTNGARRLVQTGSVTDNSGGKQGNGINGVCNTFINPSTDMIADFCIFFYSRSITTTGNPVDYGVYNTAANPGILFQAMTNIAGGTCANANYRANPSTFADTGGFWLFQRTGNAVIIERNNVLVDSYTAANLSPQNGTMRFLASLLLPATVGNYSSKIYSHFEVRSVALTAPQRTAAYNNVLTKETALGRNL